MRQATTRGKPRIFKKFTLLTLLLGIFMVFAVPHTYADDDKKDTNSNMANVSEEASKRDVYGAKNSSSDSKGTNIEDLLGDKYTSTPHSESNKGLNSVAASWSFLGLNTESGLLRPGDADTAEVSLQSLIIYNTKSDSTSNAVLKAASLPAVLQKNGLDTTKMGGLNTVGRLIMGWILMGFLALAFIANAIIALVIWLIGALNPFVIIQTLMNSSGYGLLKIPASWGDLPLIGKALDQNNIFGQIANLILSWTVPTLIIIAFGLIITMLFWIPHSRRSRTQGSLMVGLKKVTRQLLVLLILPSIAGSVFMSLYSLSANGVEAPARSVQNLVQSTFVQFGSWADHSRLYIPPTDKYNNGIALKADVPDDNNSDSATKWRYKSPTQVPITPSYILAINALGARTTDATKAFSGSSTFEWSGLSDTDKSTGGKSTAGKGNGDNLPDLKTSVIADNMNKIAGLKTTFSMVDSWLSADRYSASSYAGTIENQYNAANKNSQQSYNQAGEIIKDIKSPKDKKAVSEYLQTSKNAIRYDKNKGFYSNNVASVPGANTVEPLRGKDSVYAGLSAIGMWNYLNSRVDKGTLTQNDPRKTQNKDSVTHANVVLPGGMVLGFLSIMIIIGFIAATTFPTLAVAIVLGKMAMEAFTGWDKIIFAVGGSIRAWMRLAQIGIKLIVGIFMLGFLSLITPSIASFVITSLDNVFAGTSSWGGYVVGKAIEVIALFAVAWLLFVAFKNSISFFDAIIPNAMKDNPGDPAGAAKSIFDRGFANTMDQMTSGSNSKLGRMLNEANEYDARHNPNLAHGINGDLLRDSDGRWGLDADSEWREGDDGRSVQYLKNRDERAEDRARDREAFMKDWAQGPEASRMVKENALKADLDKARNELRELGVDVPKESETDAVNHIQDFITDDTIAMTPEVQKAAEDMQEAAEKLADIQEAKDETSAQDALSKFVKTPLGFAKGQGAEMRDAVMATEAGRLLKSVADAQKLKSKAKTPEEAAALIAQERALKEGRDVDDSEYGGFTKENQEKLDEEIANPQVNIDPNEVSKNMAQFSSEMPQELLSLESESKKLKSQKSELEQRQEELRQKHFGKIGSPLDAISGSVAQGMTKLTDREGKYPYNSLDYHDEIKAKMTRLDQQVASPRIPHYDDVASKTPSELEALGAQSHAENVLYEFDSNPENELKYDKDQLKTERESRKEAALNNYRTSRVAQQQATQAVFDSIPEQEDRLDLMLKGQDAYTDYMNRRSQERIETWANEGQIRSVNEAVETELNEWMGNQPRNFAIFRNNAADMMKKGVDRSEAIQKAYEHAITRDDEYRMMARGFDENEAMNQALGKTGADYRAEQSILQSQIRKIDDKQHSVSQEYERLDELYGRRKGSFRTSLPQERAYYDKLGGAGRKVFDKQTRNEAPILKKYLKPTADQNISVGDIFKPLKQYSDVSRAYHSQKPITGTKFTDQEIAMRKRVERKMEEMRKGLSDLGVSDYALNDDARSRKMIDDFVAARETYARAYQSTGPEINIL